MGRLTLNVLLSFAQFEREVTGERIRDKIAASKKKGMWMGGMPPLGYECRDHKLFVIDSEAETVRHIFRRYTALGSVQLLQQELDAAGIRSKGWTSATGRSWGGKPLARGALYLMLQNRIYRGQIVHKDQHYPGEHMPIIDQALWDDVQTRLAANRVQRRSGEKARNPSLLAGLLFDSDGHRMTPSHANKNGARYRYYVSRPLISTGRTGAPRALRIPAGDIEQLVGSRLGQFFSEPARVAEALATEAGSAAQQWHLQERARELAAKWPALTAMQLRPMLVTAIRQIVVGADGVDIHLLPSRLAVMLRDGASAPVPAGASVGNEEPIMLSTPTQFRRAGLGIRMLIDDAGPAGGRRRPTPSWSS